MITERRYIAKAIAEKTMHVKDMDSLKNEIAAYLLAERRTADVESLMRDVLAYRAKEGLVEVITVSAHPLTSSELQDVKIIVKDEFPAAKEVKITERIDPEVIGGVRIEASNEQLDLTVKSKLNTLKRLTAARKD